MSAQAKVQILPGQRLLFDFASHEIIIGKPLEFLLNSARTPHSSLPATRTTVTPTILTHATKAAATATTMGTATTSFEPH